MPKRRGAAAAVQEAPAWAARKISASLLDYMGPVMELMGEPEPPEDFEGFVELAIGVWNAVITDDLGKLKTLPTMRRSLLAGMARDDREFLGSTFDALVESKRELFPDDPRMVVEFELVRKGTGLTLRALGTPLPGH